MLEATSKMNLKSPSIRDHLQTSGDRVSIRDLLLRLSGHFIAEDTTKKSKIIESQTLVSAIIKEI